MQQVSEAFRVRSFTVCHAAILVLLLVLPHFLLLDLAILSAFLCVLFPAGFSEYIRHTWQHSVLLDHTGNMNYAPSQTERTYQVRG